MNRFLVSAALAALLAGCARPAITDMQTDQPFDVDSAPVEVAAAPTTIVREIYHEAPVVYVDTVYMDEEPLPPETVFVDQGYETETYVYVSEPMEPPHRGRHHDGWSPREHEPRPSRPPREREPQVPPRDRDKPRPPEGKPVPKPEPPQVIAPAHPTEPTYVPVKDDREKSPDPPYQPTPVLKAPAKDSGVVTVPGKVEKPRPIRTPAGRSQNSDGGS
jgi:hypothetical protein